MLYFDPLLFGKDRVMGLYIPVA